MKNIRRIAAFALDAALGAVVGALVLLFLLTCGTGCGGLVRGLRQGAVTVCRSSSAGYRAVVDADTAEQGEVQKMAAAATSPAEVAAAAARLAAWQKKYTVAITVVDEAQDQCELAAEAADRIEAHQAAPSGAPVDIGAWIVDLLAFAPKIVVVLTDLGAKLPAWATTILKGGSK